MALRRFSSFSIVGVTLRFWPERNTFVSVTTINIATFWSCAGQVGNLVKGYFNGMAVIGIAFHPLRSKDKAFFVGDTEADFVTELVFLVRLAFADTGAMEFMQTVELVFVVPLLNQKTVCLNQFGFQAPWFRFHLAFDVTHNPTQIGL